MFADTGVLDESRPKELFTPMPCIWLKPGRNLESPVGKPPFFETIDPDKRQVVRFKADFSRLVDSFVALLDGHFG